MWMWIVAGAIWVLVFASFGLLRRLAAGSPSGHKREQTPRQELNEAEAFSWRNRPG